MMDLTPITLVGSRVRLEPIDHHHAPSLLRAAAFDEIWTYLDEPTPRTSETIDKLIQDALNEQARGVRLPFAVVDLADERVAGSISLIDIRQRDRGVEIGWAWFTPAKWGVGVSREAVFLLMRHAFDTMRAIRVAFKTDSRNMRSQHLITGVGATQEGVFRNHWILSDGYVRHSIYYSVTCEEWPTVRAAQKQQRAEHRPETILHGPV